MINVLLHLVNWLEVLYHIQNKMSLSSLPEVRESERKARSQAEMLKNALDEHGLELRVRAANEAEAACEQRLAAAEAELEELRAQFDENERFVFVHTTTLIMDLLHWKTGRDNLFFFPFPFSSIFVVFYLGVNFLVMKSER
jgi:hypothetical protein